MTARQRRHRTLRFLALFLGVIGFAAGPDGLRFALFGVLTMYVAHRLAHEEAA